MTNAEVFNQYGTEQWVIEENLCFMLQEFCESENIRPKANLVTFIKKFMKEDTIIDVEYAEKSAIHTAKKNVVCEADTIIIDETS